MIRAPLILGALLLAALVTAEAQAQFRRPLACDDCIYDFYYYDHGSFAVQDYSCSNSTYGDHVGTDYSLIGDNGAIDTGFDVVAAERARCSAPKTATSITAPTAAARSAAVVRQRLANQVNIDHGTTARCTPHADRQHRGRAGDTVECAENWSGRPPAAAPARICTSSRDCGPARSIRSKASARRHGVAVDRAARASQAADRGGGDGRRRSECAPTARTRVLTCNAASPSAGAASMASTASSRVRAVARRCPRASTMSARCPPTRTATARAPTSTATTPAPPSIRAQSRSAATRSIKTAAAPMRCAWCRPVARAERAARAESASRG